MVPCHRVQAHCTGTLPQDVPNRFHRNRERSKETCLLLEDSEVKIAFIIARKEII